MRAMHAQKFCFLNKVGTRNPHKYIQLLQQILFD